MTKEQLNDLSIFEIRELARRTGVSTPTSKKKGELIEQILEINDGLRDPHVPKTKQGRPPKKLGGYEGLMNVFIPSNMNDIPTMTEQNRFSSTITFAQDFEPNFSYTETKIIKGYLELLSNNSAVIKQSIIMENVINEFVFVPSKTIEEFGLKAGDEIVCEASISSYDKPMIIVDIKTVNGMLVQDNLVYNADYYKIKHTSPTRKITASKYEDLDLLHGENASIIGSNYNENSELAISLLNSISDAKKIYINTSIVEKNKDIVNKIIDAELFVCNMSVDAKTVTRNIDTATNRARRLFELNNNVVILIDDLLSLSCIDDNLTYTKALMSLAKSTESNGSITIVAIIPKLTDEKIKALFERLIDKKIVINNGKLTRI